IIEVVQDKGVKGEFPLFRNLAETGYVTLLNDTIEISAASLPDTVEIGSNRIQINYNMLVQVFDSGYYKIPGLEYVAGRDTVRSKYHYLKVIPVNVTAEDKISPMTDVQPPEDSSIFDVLPDWIVKWWWLILLVCALAYAGYRLAKRYRQTGSILPPKPEVPAHIEALERLKRLKARHIWEDGKEKEYYTILTDILRLYLDRRFGIKAMEMTSKEIMSTLADDKQLMASNELISQILKIADFVKFAKVRPLPDDNVKAFDNAVKFVEDTAPKDEVPDSATDTVNTPDKESDVSRKGGAK
ncbi:MAG: DUF4381 domain-containing protein, partial [Muribaculaceae bacterium]|nr:DUF4381 domain-containing protein [Muribaculaceae bacterium]